MWDNLKTERLMAKGQLFFKLAQIMINTMWENLRMACVTEKEQLYITMVKRTKVTLIKD